MRWVRWVLVGLIFCALAAGIPAFAVGRQWVREGEALARAHRSFESTHPGWSFPGRVLVRAMPDAQMSPARRIAEAKVRGYVDGCKAPGPGTYCEKTQSVTPRFGTTLEDVQLGMLIGPEGELRTHLPIEEAPKHLIDAILAAEDRDFRNHSGVSVTGLLRAAVRNSREGQYAQGGSTLTMQVVRNLNQRSEKTIARKLREAGLAIGLENELGKDGVLQMYLDAPYLGQRGTFSVSGFQEASRHYFGIDAQQLDLAQAATLVAILPGPGKFAPDRHPENCKARRDHILTELGRINGYDVAAALATPLTLSAPSTSLAERFPAYLNAVRTELERRFPKSVVYSHGLTVEVGIDLVMQAEAETLFPVKTKAFELLVGRQKSGPLQAVGVAMDTKSGLIRALYGGHDISSTGFNRATQSHRQPGSSFKPLVYALAFSQVNADGTPKFTAASTQPNLPRVFKTPQGDWRPYNVSGESSVTASLAQGLAWSQNIATASLLDTLGGPRPLIEFAKNIGFDVSTFPEEYGLSLGQAEVTPLEMAMLAATIGNGGLKITPSTLVRVVDVSGAERASAPVAGASVMTPEAAALTRELMRLVVDNGTGGAIRGVAGEGGYQGQVMGKTGTTDSEKDLWFVGATPRHAMAVWLGYDQPVRVGAAAADLAAPLWGWWMGHSTRVDGGKPPEFTDGPKVTRQVICTITGLKPNDTCKMINAPFLANTGPKGTCEVDHTLEQAYAPEAHESLWKRKAREAAEADAGVQEDMP